MKRAMIGGFLSIVGSIWALAAVIAANGYFVEGWSNPPGKLLTQMSESGLLVWFAVSVGTVLLGLVLIAAEYVRKDD